MASLQGEMMHHSCYNLLFFLATHANSASAFYDCEKPDNPKRKSIIISLPKQNQRKKKEPEMQNKGISIII